MAPRSIMVDGRYLGPAPSGIGRYTIELVRGMRELRPDVAWRVVARRPEHTESVPWDDRVYFDAGEYGIRTSLFLRFRLGPRPADLFHSPFHVLPSGLACPTVMTMHDVFQFEQPRFSNFPMPVAVLEWAYFRAAIPASLRAATRILCVSRHTADEVGRRVPDVRTKLRVVHHGVTPHFRVLDREHARARAAELTGSEAPFVLCIGGISFNKNHERMIRAFARAFSDDDVRLVTVARFGPAGRLEAEARRAGLGARYRVLSRPSDEDVICLLNAAELFAFCSTHEGFGLPILEAMACGCPVVTSNVSCIPEVAGDAAVACNPYDEGDIARAFVRVHESPALRAELGERGVARAAGFTWSRCATETLAVYDEALRTG
jgi:glycosyltransferase involved in cell wall biosynthesis